MKPDTDTIAASPPALAFTAPDAATAVRPANFEPIPADALVLWEYERADRYRRVFGLVTENKLKLVRVSAGFETSIEVIAEASIADDAVVLRPHFLTRDVFVLWADASGPGRPVARTIVLRVGARLKMLRVVADEAHPAIEILHDVPTG